MFGNTYYGYVTKVQSALNGQYIVGVSKYADISGNTYNNVNSTVGGVGNVFINSIPMSGLLMTQFMGSSNTNGVSQRHGLQLSVPTVNNASLMMGYDVNLDSAYINSADNNGGNMLGINTNGGYVGIGKATPMVELDVSGSLSVTGNFVIGGSTVTTGQSTFDTVNIVSTAQSTSTTTGALTVNGGAGIRGNVNIGGNISIGGDLIIGGSTINTGQSTFDAVNIISTVPSTTTTTGALRVSGGAGIGGNVNVGGFSSFALDSTLNGNLLLSTVNNPLWFVSRNASIINSTIASGNDVGIFYGTNNPGSTGLVISPRGAGGGIKMDIRGNVGIGTSTPVNTLDVIGSIRATTFLNVGSPNPPTNTTGNISASGQIAAQSFNATSDYRMKNNIQPLLITRTVDKLNPVEYDMSGGNHDMGFLAHEVQEIFPFLVSGEKDGPYMQSMNYNGFIALLVKEIQDLKKENKIINARLENIEKKLM
jgi:hypothetical protein